MAAIELQKSVLINSANLKAYYRFESGAETTDSSGNSHTLTAIGTPTYSAGKFGQSTDLASSAGYSIVSHADLQPTGAFTIGGWVKTASAAAAEGIIQSYANDGGKIRGIILYMDITTGKLTMISGKNTGTTLDTDYKVITGTTNLATGNWTHVIGTWDGATLRLYVNGAHQSSAAWANAPGYGTVYPRVGCISNDGTNNSFLTGSLDDVFLLNGTALSPDQIKELYEGRTVGELWAQSNLQGLWHLNGNETCMGSIAAHLTNTGVTYASGKFGKAAVFDASGDKLLNGVDASPFNFERTDSFTISAWIKINSIGVNRFIVSKQIPSGNFNGYALWQPSTNEIELDLIRATGTTGIQIATPQFTTIGVWTFIVATYNGSSSAAGTHLYINGSEPAKLTVADALNASMQSTAVLEIGNRNGAFNFDGMIDEVAIFNVAKDAAWVRKQYAWGLGKYV